MADDQQRSAERIPLEKPIHVTLNDVPGWIVEISLVGCRVEHVGRVNMGSTVTMQFEYQRQKIKLKAKVTRTEMRPVAGKPAYVSALQLAGSLIESPPALRWLIGTLVEKVEKETRAAAAQTAPVEADNADLSPYAAPSLYEQVEEIEEIEEIPVTAEIADEPEIEVQPEIEEIEPIEEIAEINEIDDSPAAEEPAPDEEPPPPEEPPPAEEPAPSYVQCTMVDGKWRARTVKDPKQPREGFTMLAPESTEEIRQYCRTYEVADPDTRRMIRASFEVGIAQRQRGGGGGR